MLVLPIQFHIFLKGIDYFEIATKISVVGGILYFLMHYLGKSSSIIMEMNFFSNPIPATHTQRQLPHPSIPFNTTEAKMATKGGLKVHSGKLLRIMFWFKQLLGEKHRQQR